MECLNLVSCDSQAGCLSDYSVRDEQISKKNILHINIQYKIPKNIFPLLKIRSGVGPISFNILWVTHKPVILIYLGHLLDNRHYIRDGASLISP